MFLSFDHRPSDSPFIDRVWRCRSTRPGTFLSVAATHRELVLTRHRGRLRVTLRGPETRPSPIDVPADAEWIGIRLATGAYLPLHPAASLRDRQDLDLPLPTRRTFWLDGSAWEHRPSTTPSRWSPTCPGPACWPATRPSPPRWPVTARP
jgi:hypothetical protein